MNFFPYPTFGTWNINYTYNMHGYSTTTLNATDNDAAITLALQNMFYAIETAESLPVGYFGEPSMSVSGTYSHLVFMGMQYPGVMSSVLTPSTGSMFSQLPQYI